VRFLARYVPEPELPAYFRRADVVVLPYLRTDRFDHSGVLAAALAFGKATVLSEVGGFPEVAANTGAAVLVPPNDHAALRAALGELIVDPDARERLSEAALRAAAGPYSWAAAAERTLSLYRELTGSP
jgi:glycosyltransferase involved in cell wall biosynthesis